MADFEHFKGFFEEVTGKPYGVVEKPQKGAKKTVKGAKDEGEKKGKKLTPPRILDT